MQLRRKKPFDNMNIYHDDLVVPTLIYHLHPYAISNLVILSYKWKKCAMITQGKLNGSDH